MPIYEYDCVDCGQFSALNAIARCNEPFPCPSCREPSRRVVSAPNLSLMKSSNRRAWERNEKSAHQPKFRRSNCGCSGSHTCRPDQSTSKTSIGAPTLVKKNGPSKRPWMLGH